MGCWLYAKTVKQICFTTQNSFFKRPTCFCSFQYMVQKIVFKMLHCLHMDVPQTPRCDSSRRILIWISYIACQSYVLLQYTQITTLPYNLHCDEMTSGILDTYSDTTRFSLKEHFPKAKTCMCTKLLLLLLFSHT